MNYKKPQLDKISKHASDFINYICDEDIELDLYDLEGGDLVLIDSNCGSGGKIYIDEVLEPIFNKFIEENKTL